MGLFDSLPERVELADGVDLLYLAEPRFKRALVQLDFDVALDAGAGARTLLAQVLEQGSERFPSRMHLAQEQERLYGAAVSIGGLRAAEKHRMRLRASWVGERFLPAGEPVAAQTLELTRELLENPVRGDQGEPFPTKVVERERDQLARHIRSFVDDRAGYAQQRFYETMCAGEPFAQAPWGRAEEVERLTASELEMQRQRLLREARVLILAVGPIERASLVETLQSWFSDLQGEGSERPPLPAAVFKQPTELREHREELPVDQARFHLGFRVPVPTESVEMEALLLANSVLGGGIQGRLFRIVREERSLAYGISSEVLAGKGLLTVGAGIDASKAEEVRDEVLRQARLLAESGPTEEELAMAKAAFANGLRSLGDGAASLARFFQREEQFGLRRTPAERARVVESLTAEQLQQAAAQWVPDTSFLLAAPEPALQASR